MRARLLSAVVAIAGCCSFAVLSWYGLFLLSVPRAPDRELVYPASDGRRSIAVRYFAARGFMGNSSISAIELHEIHQWPFRWKNRIRVMHFLGEPDDLRILWPSDQEVLLIYQQRHHDPPRGLANPRGVIVRIREIDMVTGELKTVLN